MVPAIPHLVLQPISRFILCRLPLRTLLDRPGIDSSFIFHSDGSVYMFVFFAPARLELFLSKDILSRDFRPHPKSPIYNRCLYNHHTHTWYHFKSLTHNSNKKYARNGGRPYLLDGLWHRCDPYQKNRNAALTSRRPAQDITGLYGSQLHIMRITLLSATEYASSISQPHSCSDFVLADTTRSQRYSCCRSPSRCGVGGACITWTSSRSAEVCPRRRVAGHRSHQ
jgi:hypothetical protein